MRAKVKWMFVNKKVELKYLGYLDNSMRGVSVSRQKGEYRLDYVT